MRLAALFALLIAAPANAQTAVPPPPKLIVAISVDQFSADLFAEYRRHYTGGLARLADGVVFPSGYQSHAATETCPGHSTILTGSRPARTGIIANSWFDQRVTRADKQVYCAEDERVAGSTYKAYTVSPLHLKVPTLGDRMKAANPATRVVAVAGKDRAAVMMGGHRTDTLYWWSTDRFVGPDGQAPTATLPRANAAVTAQIAQARAPLHEPPLCRIRNRAIVAGSTTVGSGRFARDAGDAKGFRISPEMDGATLALAAGLIAELKLGRGAATDLIAVGLSATDYVGHSFGSEGGEMCLQQLALDRSLGDFLAALDATGVDYAVVLTADHGGHDLNERLREHAFPDARRHDGSVDAALIGAEIAKKLGLAKSPLLVTDPFGDIWIDRALTKRQHDAVLAEAVRAYSALPQVGAVLTAAQIAATPIPVKPPELWTIAERSRASYDPDRSGDLVVWPRPYLGTIAKPAAGYTSGHGTPYDSDRRVPILFWRKGLAPFEQPASVETIDIMPTLAAWIALPLPTKDYDGRCLDLDAGTGSSCP